MVLNLIFGATHHEPAFATLRANCFTLYSAAVFKRLSTPGRCASSLSQAKSSDVPTLLSAPMALMRSKIGLVSSRPNLRTPSRTPSGGNLFTQARTTVPTYTTPRLLPNPVFTYPAHGILYFLVSRSNTDALSRRRAVARRPGPRAVASGGDRSLALTLAGLYLGKGFAHEWMFVLLNPS